jgi:hypothetical protein
MNRNLSKVFFMVLGAVFLLSAPSVAGIYWESENISQGMAIQPAGAKKIFKHYITESASRTDMGDQINIMDYDSMMLYQIDPRNKTYSKMSLNDMGQMPGMDKADAKGMQEMMKQMMNSRKVIHTNQSKEIAGYTCKVVNVSIMMTNTEHCVSTEIPHYSEVKILGKKIGKRMSQSPMFQQMGIGDMIEELGGFSVQTVTRSMGGTQTTTLKTIKKMDMKDDLFTVPAGYREVAPY